jgi:hypothetical protein
MNGIVDLTVPSVVPGAHGLIPRGGFFGVDRYAIT